MSRGQLRLRRLGRLLAIAAVFAAAQAIAPTAGAWNQLVAPPNGSCSGAPPTPCIRWKKTSDNLSINVDIFLRGSLSCASENLKPEVRDAIDGLNGIAARNPHLRETTTTSGMEWEVIAESFGDPEWLGETIVSYNSTSPYRIVSALTRFNTQIQWNRSESYSCWSIPVAPHTQCTADIRKVAIHELGHGEGLAHEYSPTISIMRQWEVPWHTLRPDDINGITSIYGAYP